MSISHCASRFPYLGEHELAILLGQIRRNRPPDSANALRQGIVGVLREIGVIGAQELVVHAPRVRRIGRFGKSEHGFRHTADEQVLLQQLDQAVVKRRDSFPIKRLYQFH